MMKSLAVWALSMVGLSTPVLAQAEEAPLRQYVAFGTAALPDYSGSDDYRFIPFGALRLEYGDIVIRNEGPGLAAELYQSGPVKAGIYARWSGGRDDVDDTVVSLLDDVDNSVIAGGFVDLTVAQAVLSPYDSVSINAKIGADLLGEFEGAAWSSGVSYSGPLSRTSFVSLGLSVSGYSDDYAELLYSVDAAGSTASGLPIYMAEGGASDIGLTGVYAKSFRSNLMISGVAGWSRLLGDYADSPLVTDRGDEDQYLVGIMLGRQF
jgi:outer membrane protein